MGGAPRPTEPMGPYRSRALKYTPMGPHRPRALEYTPTGGSLRPGSLRPIGHGPSALAHRPWPMEPMGPHRSRALKYTPTGGSLRPIGLGPWNISPPGGPRGPSALAHRPWPIGPGPWSLRGPPMGSHMGRPKEPTRGPTFSHVFLSQSRPSWDSIRQLPGPLANLCKQRLIPELPGALGSPMGGGSKSAYKIRRIMTNQRNTR